MDKKGFAVATEYRCGCGEWAGEPCGWRGPLSEMVVVEWMPEHLRDSHAAARNSGCYPHNGAARVACHHECADLLIESEGDPESWPDGCCWAEVVDADPAGYAEEAGDV
jgi:hypothetical protein